MAFIGAKPTNVPLTSSDLQDSIITSAKIVDGTIATADISDGAVTSVKTTGVGGANTPAFMANLASIQSISNGTATKVNMSTEIFDTDSKYDNSNYRFTPTVAGKYFVYAQIMFTAYGSDGTPAGLQIRKNGSTIHESYERSAQSSNFDFYIHISSTVVLDNDDYIEIFAHQDSGTSKSIYHGSLYSFWGAYKIIE